MVSENTLKEERSAAFNKPKDSKLVFNESAASCGLATTYQTEHSIYERIANGASMEEVFKLLSYDLATAINEHSLKNPIAKIAWEMKDGKLYHIETGLSLEDLIDPPPHLRTKDYIPMPEHAIKQQLEAQAMLAAGNGPILDISPASWYPGSDKTCITVMTKDGFFHYSAPSDPEQLKKFLKEAFKIDVELKADGSPLGAIEHSNFTAPDRELLIKASKLSGDSSLSDLYSQSYKPLEDLIKDAEIKLREIIPDQAMASGIVDLKAVSKLLEYVESQYKDIRAVIAERIEEEFLSKVASENKNSIYHQDVDRSSDLASSADLQIESFYTSNEIKSPKGIELSSAKSLDDSTSMNIKNSDISVISDVNLNNFKQNLSSSNSIDLISSSGSEYKESRNLNNSNQNLISLDDSNLAFSKSAAYYKSISTSEISTERSNKESTLQTINQEKFYKNVDISRFKQDPIYRLHVNAVLVGAKTKEAKDLVRNIEKKASQAPAKEPKSKPVNHSSEKQRVQSLIENSKHKNQSVLKYEKSIKVDLKAEFSRQKTLPAQIKEFREIVKFIQSIKLTANLSKERKQVVDQIKFLIEKRISQLNLSATKTIIAKALLKHILAITNIKLAIKDLSNVRKFLKSLVQSNDLTRLKINLNKIPIGLLSKLVHQLRVNSSSNLNVKEQATRVLKQLKDIQSLKKAIKLASESVKDDKILLSELTAKLLISQRRLLTLLSMLLKEGCLDEFLAADDDWLIALLEERPQKTKRQMRFVRYDTKYKLQILMKKSKRKGVIIHQQDPRSIESRSDQNPAKQIMLSTSDQSPSYELNPARIRLLGKTTPQRGRRFRR